MENRSNARSLRGQLLSRASHIGLIALTAGAALAAVGITFAPESAAAADVVCAPNPSGTAIASATETCTGTGDKIDYATLPATISSTVTLNAVTIPGFAGNAVAISPGTTAQTVIVNSGGSIVATGGDGIRIFTPTGGTGTQSVGTSASRVLSPITGGAGALAGNAIQVTGLGDVNVFTGNVAIVSTSTAGASWAIRAQSLPTVLSGSGGAVVVDTLGAVTAQRGAIQARATGTDASDSVTVISAGPVTGIAGAGIQGQSVNGNTTITASGNVIGSTGTGTHGISVTVSGSGTAAITTLAGATVTGTGAGVDAINAATTTGSLTVNTSAGGALTGASNGLAATATTGAISITVGSATGTAGSGISATTTTGASTININGTVRGLGGATTGAVNLVSGTAGVITLNNNATGVIQSVAGLTSDLAVGAATAGTGIITINNAGRINGRVNLSGAASSTFNNTGATAWHTAGTSTLTAGSDVLNNSGLLATNGVTTLDFGGGADVFNNSASGVVFGAETAGASTTTITGLETFNNSGSINLVDNEANDVLNAASAAYVSSGAATISLDAALGSSAGQSACAAPTVADCVVFGAASGTGTTIIVNDTNAAGAGTLDPNGIVLVHATSGTAADFVLGGTNALLTAQGMAIQKGVVQYQLAFDAANSNFVLAGVPSGAAVEMGTVMAGMQNLWHMTAEGADERIAAIRSLYAAAQGSGLPVMAQANRTEGVAFWAKGYYGEFRRDTSSTVGGLDYDTSYKQKMGGVQVGVDYLIRESVNSGWVFGVLAGYNPSTQRFQADLSKTHSVAWNVGAYASYLNGPLFADLLLKDDITRMKFDFPTLGTSEKEDGNSFGGKLTVGARFDGMGFSLEPMGSLSYVWSSLSSYGVPGTTFDFDDGNSFRGTLGLRLSTVTDQSGIVMQPFLFAGVGEEFDGENTVTLTNISTIVEIKDRPMRMFGIGSLGFNVFGDNGIGGFVRVDGLYASRTHSVAFWAGVRLAR